MVGLRIDLRDFTDRAPLVFQTTFVVRFVVSVVTRGGAPSNVTATNDTRAAGQRVFLCSREKNGTNTVGTRARCVSLSAVWAGKLHTSGIDRVQLRTRSQWPRPACTARVPLGAAPRPCWGDVTLVGSSARRLDAALWSGNGATVDTSVCIGGGDPAGARKAPAQRLTGLGWRYQPPFWVTATTLEAFAEGFTSVARVTMA